MNYLDYSIIAFYFVVMLWMGFKLRNQTDSGNYFLGGKTFGWFSLCMSAMASQLSVISFVSAPAFVGLREGGGMKWLTFEFGVPVAMIVVMTFIGPALYKSGVVSIYSFLEKRFNTTTRLLLSSVFMFSRSFAAGVTIYAVSLILSSLLHISFTTTVLLVGLSTVLYSLEGGMKAVVYSEVLQMIIKVTGIIIIIFYGLKNIGGWDNFVANVDNSRLQVIDFSNFGFDGGEYGFWPMLIGGIFLYTSYYGTDQMQAQRILSAKDLPTVRNVLLFNGLLRFPITFMYCLGGLIVGTFVALDADFMQMIPTGKSDLMIPLFIENYLPNGIIGVLVVAIIAAAMSAFSSTLNSLSAVTMEEIVSKKMELTDKKYVRTSKIVALGWGVLTLILAFFVGDIAKTVIEAINKIGSVFYGPLLATFLAAILLPRINGRGINIGLVAGVLVNAYLWLFVPDVFWFWWNAIGAAVTLTVGSIASVFAKDDKKSEMASEGKKAWEYYPKSILILLAFFTLILLFCLLLPTFFS